MAEQIPSYDVHGTGYDDHRRADAEIARRLRGHLDLSAGRAYLDLACGTGNYTIALHAFGGHWTGVDASDYMLDMARRKSDAIDWRHAPAESLPFEDAMFHGVSCMLAIHHFESLEPAFDEVRRVLRPGGRFVCFTSTAEQMESYWLNEYWPVALRRSIEQMPAMAAIEDALRAAGLEVVELDPYEVSPTLSDSFLYRGKHHPAHYLDPEVRRAASTFSMLADPAEVEAGCARLRDDIATGRIDEVRQRYADRPSEPAGDYLFVQARVAP